MTLDWQAFTPWPSLAGGLIIGGATALLLLWGGRIAGISGIVGGLLRPAAGPIAWRLAFIGGLMAAPWVWRVMAGPVAFHVDAAWPAVLVAGLLVGVGTRYGAGCTSGHGVCGLSRLSPRSAVATAAFMGSGMVTVAVLRHLWGGG